MSGGDLSGGGCGRGEGELKQMAELSKYLKEGERLLAPSRRPDGSFRKPIRIRAGYVPQEEVAIYQSKGALWKKEMAASHEMPPGYDLALDGKPKTKSAKRNERKKEKRLQTALEKDTNLDVAAAGERIAMVGDSDHTTEPITSMTAQLDDLSVSENGTFNNPPSAVTEDSNSVSSSQDIDKRIRALKKKIRLAEGQQQKNGEKDLSREQQEKLTKLEGWRQEMKCDDKANDIVRFAPTGAHGFVPHLEPAYHALAGENASLVGRQASHPYQLQPARTPSRCGTLEAQDFLYWAGLLHSPPSRDLVPEISHRRVDSNTNCDDKANDIVRFAPTGAKRTISLALSSQSHQRRVFTCECVVCRLEVRNKSVRACGRKADNIVGLIIT